MPEAQNESSENRLRLPFGQHIDCSAHPLDLSPVAHKVLSAIDTRRSELKPDQPLAVLIGEDHAAPAHIELQYMIIHNLKLRQEKFLVAIELPYNFWQRITNTPPSRHKQVQRLNLSAALGHSRFYFAPQAQNNLLAYCLQNRINTLFNDVALVQASFTASQEEALINKNDPAIQIFIGEYAQSCPESHLSAETREGIDIRNRAMAHRALTYTPKRSEPFTLIIQKAGCAHILGDPDSGLPYESSLQAQFIKQGASVLSILPKGVTPLEPRIEGVRDPKHRENIIVVENLANDRFADFLENLDQEQKFIDSLHRARGHAIAHRRY